MTKNYYRPLVHSGSPRPDGAVSLAGGWGWFTHAERMSRADGGVLLPVEDIPTGLLQRLTSPRPDFAGLSMGRPHLMGILNVTPDSFSDGGRLEGSAAIRARAAGMIAEGVSILDIGGESTRPGAAPVPVAEELARVLPALAAMPEGAVLSIDTRKAAVAEVALGAGAKIFNDVSALTYDPESVSVAVARSAFICLMHAQGDPQTMQDAPHYDNIVLDVYDFLEEKVAAAAAAGIPRDRICIDPGIGFGKTMEHNLALLRNLSLFHGLGVPILLGVSRKRFIGTIGGAERAEDRAPGSIAVGLEGLRQGVQILRVHDTAETAQALALWRALN
ncbi:MAG: dihydropteroate synthase [Rubricella sp.]